MNKIYRIIWNSALNAWVVVSELTRNHTKRASATVATAVLATLLSATAQASTTGSESEPNYSFDPSKPTFDDEFKKDGGDVPDYKFGLVVVGKDGKVKTNFGHTDEEQGKNNISVEASESSGAKPENKTSYLYLRENGGIEIDQEGRSAKFKVKAGDGLKIDDATDKLVADTVNLTVTNGKVSTPKNGDNKKLVNADNLATELNKLGWQLKTTNGAAAAGNGTTSTVKSGDEVEFKGEGGVTVTSTTDTSTGKHTVTIKAAQTKGANKGGAWKITADKEGTGEVDPANNATESEVNTGEKVTLKAGDNLKIKQNGKDFTYSLKKELKGLTGVETEKLSFGTNGNKVNITSDNKGLNFAKETAGANGDTTVHLNGIGSTLTDTLLNTGSTTNVTNDNVTDDEKKRAASVKDVLNAGWNIKGVKPGTTASDNVDFVRTYDTVEFLSADTETTTVNVESKDNGKRTEVKIGAKTSVIEEKDGKLLTGKQLKDANTGAAANPTEDADEGNGLVTAKAVIDAVNKSGWRVSGEGTTAENGATAVTADQAQTVTSGTSVNFKNGNATTATVSKDNGNINVKYDVTTGDGLKVDNQKITVDTGDGLKLDNQKIVADTTTLTVTDGKVTAPTADTEKKKLVNAEGLVNALNKLSWKAKADKEDSGEVDPTTANEQEVKAGETVTFKAGKNLKVKQSEKDFTYSLKDELTGLTSIALGTAGNGANGASTKIDKDGLTITLANDAGATDANKISVTKDGISAGNKAITNVASGLKTYGDTQNGQPTANTNTAKNGLINLDTATTPANGGGTGTSVADTTAATVGDLRKLGWVLSADKTTNGTDTTAFHAAVKNAEEVEFKGTGAATVSAKTENGKHTITVDVQKAEIETSDGIEKTNDGKIKLKVDNTDGNNVLTVDATKGASVTKGELEVASTDTTAGQGTNTADRGKVKVKGVNGTETENDKKKVATAVDVAKAINEAATFVKVQSSDEDIENDAATKDAADDQALKAGDTLTFKAGKNLKAKLDKNGKSVTFALAKSIETDSATLSKTLSIGENDNKVNITSDTNGLNLAKAVAGANNDTTLHLNGIASTLQDTLAGTQTTKVEKEANTITDEEKHRAASVQDVFNAGWNIKGVKPNETASSNVDFVRTYDTVEFLSGSEETTTVTVDSKENGKRTEVKIGAKTSVIKEHNGKLLTGKQLKEANTGTATNTAEDADEGKGLVTAEAVINAVNKAGWRIKTTSANGQAGDNFETVASGTNVTFDNGNGTTASVTKDANGNGITVKYDVNVGDGLKIGDGDKIVADTTTLTVNGAAANGAVDNTTPKGKVKEITSEDDKKKLVKAGDLVTALNSLSWTATADAEDGGEKEGNATEQEVKAGDKVTFKAGKNLKVKQDNANFTYSLKDELTGLTSITLGNANGGTANGATTKIDQNV